MVVDIGWEEFIEMKRKENSVVISGGHLPLGVERPGAPAAGGVRVASRRRVRREQARPGPLRARRPRAAGRGAPLHRRCLWVPFRVDVLARWGAG